MSDLQEIYQLYADDVKRFLICLTANPELSEELTQETFYQAVKSIHRYNGKCKMSVWLCQIAKHLYYDYLKKTKHYQSVNFDNMINEINHDTDESTESQAEKRAEIITLYKQINALNSPYCEVFLLRTSADLSYHDIGEIFDKNENWARVTYYRAKIKLMERIETNEDNL